MQEEELVLNCQNGDADAFGQLYDKYFEKIYRFIYYKISHQETTEDLVSLTFTKALENLDKFRTNKGSFSSWLYKIARNTVIDYYRTKREVKNIDYVYDIHSQQNIEEDMTKDQQLQNIREKLDALKPEQREIVIMRIWDELSYKEISQIINKSEASCKMTFSRAIKTIKASLAIIILWISLLTI